MSILKELKTIDEENKQYYELEEKELRRIRRYKILMMIAYTGITLLAISILYRFATDKTLSYVGRIGQGLALGGLIAAYFFRNSVKSKGSTIEYRSWHQK